MHDIFGRKLTSSEKDYVVKLTTSDNLNAEILTISDDNVISISDSKEIFTNVKMRIRGLEEENKVVVNLYEEKNGVKYLLDKEEFNTGKDNFNSTKELDLKRLTIGFKHENLKAEIITTDLEGNEKVILTEKNYKIAENPTFKISNVTEDNIINLKETIQTIPMKINVEGLKEGSTANVVIKDVKNGEEDYTLKEATITENGDFNFEVHAGSILKGEKLSLTYTISNKNGEISEPITIEKHYSKDDTLFVPTISISNITEDNKLTTEEINSGKNVPITVTVNNIEEGASITLKLLDVKMDGESYAPPTELGYISSALSSPTNPVVIQDGVLTHYFYVPPEKLKYGTIVAEFTEVDKAGNDLSVASDDIADGVMNEFHYYSVEGGVLNSNVDGRETNMFIM